MNKRRLLFAGLSSIVIIGSLASGTAAAQTWPAKTVRVIVPFTPGGTADTLGRLVAQKLGENLKQTFVVENRPGAGGVTGSDLVAKAAPDGYTLIVSGVASHAIAPALSKKFPYDPMRDFTHIASFGGPPNVVSIHPAIPAKNLKEFIAHAKRKPGELTYGSPGNGTQGHLFAENLKQITGIEMVHVPYKGSAPAMTDLIAGHTSATSTTLSTAASHIRAGKARALAVSSKSRVADFPDIPTFAELGYPELTAVTWFSLSGPPGMPDEIVQRLNAEVRKILQMPDVKEKLRPEGIEPADLTVQAFNSFVAAEVKRWAPVVRSSGAQVD